MHNPPANGKQKPILEEMSQTLLTNKKQGTWTKYTPITLLQTRINQEEYFFRYKIIVSPKNCKTGRVPYLGLELTMHVIKSQIYLVRRSL